MKLAFTTMYELPSFFMQTLKRAILEEKGVNNQEQYIQALSSYNEFVGDFSMAQKNKITDWLKNKFDKARMIDMIQFNNEDEMTQSLLRGIHLIYEIQNSRPEEFQGSPNLITMETLQEVVELCKTKLDQLMLFRRYH